MDRKYQIFISSTYEDLKDIRTQAVMEILKMGHIPIGMEMFNPEDDEQWEQIKKRIDESDYFVLIVANRYGSLTKDRKMSSTEKEYNYALKKNIPIIRFVISDDGVTSAKNMEQDPQKLNMLNNFKQRIKKKYTGFWKNPDDFAAKLVQALYHYFKVYPRKGWVSGEYLINAESMEKYGLKEYGEKAVNFIKESIEKKLHYNFFDRKVTLTLLDNNQGLEVDIVNEFVLANVSGIDKIALPCPCFESYEQAASYENEELLINGESQKSLIQTKIQIREGQIQLPYIVKNSIDSKKYRNEKEVCILHRYKYKRKSLDFFMAYQLMIPCKDFTVTANLYNDLRKEYKFLCFSASQYRNKRENGWKSEIYHDDHSCQINFAEWTMPGAGYCMVLVRQEHK